MELELGWKAAPSGPVGPDGRILFGRYAGACELVDWSKSSSGRLWRFLHWKRWQYASVVTPEAVLAAAIVDLGWSSTAFAYVFERRSRRLASDLSGLRPPGGARVAATIKPPAVSTYRDRRLAVAIEANPGSWRLTVAGPGLEIDAGLFQAASTATVCAIAPVPGGRANCTHKTHGLRATGHATAGGHTFDLAGGLAALDHTSGLLARATSWQWASGASERVSINLVAGFHEPFENAAWFDGQLVALPPVTFHREPDPAEPWRVSSNDSAVDLTFQPEGLRSQDKSVPLATSRWVQPIGTYRGRLCGDDIGVLAGVIEDHVARW